jgi:hypothetical protein
MAVMVLFRDGSERVLLVNSTCKETWPLRGGAAGADESPHAACHPPPGPVPGGGPDRSRACWPSQPGTATATSAARALRSAKIVGDASSTGWWQAYSDVTPAWFQPYLGLEHAAAMIRDYQVQFIPGLLQTPGYARAVFHRDPEHT